MQDRLLSVILPSFGVDYVHLSSLRGPVKAPPRTDAKDWIRIPLESPAGEQLQKDLLEGLQRLLQNHD